ncbi:hypothetical protein C0993_010321, partial [Termitomyces sp. T159_Od127]
YANSGYRLFDQANRTIVTSQDMIFDKGTGHRSLMLLNNEDEEAPPQANIPAPAQQTSHTISTQQPVAPRIRPGPLHTDHPTDSTTTHVQPVQTPQASNQPPPLRRLTRQMRPTPALIAAQETLQCKQRAHEEGEDWAAGEDIPVALMAEGPYSYLNSIDWSSGNDNM